MAWSTQQIADLAGTTTKAVRYYHQIGLLDEPERSANGFHKQYQVPHLIRLLQIKRLTDLGVPLAELESLGGAGDDPAEALEALDSRLKSLAEQIAETRSDVATIRRHSGSTYLPSDFASISAEFTDRQRELLMAFSTVFSSESLHQFRELLADPSDIDREFEALPADADADAVEQLATRMLPVVLESREQKPWSKTPTADAPGGAERAEQTMAEAMAQLYNPAQRRVLLRLRQLLDEQEASS